MPPPCAPRRPPLYLPGRNGSGHQAPDRGVQCGTGCGMQCIQRHALGPLKTETSPDLRRSSRTPVTFHPHVAAPSRCPVPGNPHVARALWDDPVAGHPHIPPLVSSPRPVTRNPDISRPRLDGHHLHLRGRRGWGRPDNDLFANDAAPRQYHHRKAEDSPQPRHRMTLLGR